MEFTSQHWLGTGCLQVAGALIAVAIVRWRQSGVWPWTCYLPAAILTAYGIGAFGFLAPSWLGAALAVTAFVASAGMLALVIGKGSWSPPLAYAVTGIFFFGLGDLTGASVAEGLYFAGLFVVSLRPQEPAWLLLLLAIPVLIWTSYRNLITLGPIRQWIDIGLRCCFSPFRC